MSVTYNPSVSSKETLRYGSHTVISCALLYRYILSSWTWCADSDSNTCKLEIKVRFMMGFQFFLPGV